MQYLVLFESKSMAFPAEKKPQSRDPSLPTCNALLNALDIQKELLPPLVSLPRVLLNPVRFSVSHCHLQQKPLP